MKKAIVVILIVVAIAAVLVFARGNKAPEPEISTWQTFNDPARSLSFRYPAQLPADYIDVVDWPPQVQIVDGPFVCTEAGLETARAGETKKITFNDREYCVTKVTEGAAGSIYTQYAYATSEDDKTVILTFSLRSPQCANYDEPQKSECEAEKTGCDINRIVDQIVTTIEMGK